MVAPSSNNDKFNTIISIKEARKIMGKESEKYSDEQIVNLINDLDIIALLHFEMVPNISK